MADSTTKSTTSNPDGTELLRVIVRCRELNRREIENGCERVVNVDTKENFVTVRNPTAEKWDQPKKVFNNFEKVYDFNSSQKKVFDESFRDVVDSVLQGYNGTIFAYGQTGAGKTYTIRGVKDNHAQRGVVPRAAECLFSSISQSRNQQYLVRVSYIQIYMEEVHDLLVAKCGQRMEIKERPETGVYIKDLTSIVVKSDKELEEIWKVGNLNKDIWTTNMGALCSKIATIFTITVESCEIGEDGDKCIKVGRLNLVDMAGSERASKTGASSAALREANRIGMSISSFGNVVSSLVDSKSKYVPYRDSKLTRLLADSLGGTAKTVMVACISPASCNYNETLPTLRYADRASRVKNKPKIHVDPKYFLFLEYQKEMERLKAKLLDGKDIVKEVTKTDKDFVAEKKIAGDTFSDSDRGGEKFRESMLEHHTKQVGENQEIEETSDTLVEEKDFVGEKETCDDALQDTDMRVENLRESAQESQRKTPEEKHEKAVTRADIVGEKDKDFVTEKETEETEAVALKIKAMERGLLTGGQSHVLQEANANEQHEKKTAFHFTTDTEKIRIVFS